MVVVSLHNYRRLSKEMELESQYLLSHQLISVSGWNSEGLQGRDNYALRKQFGGPKAQHTPS